MQKNVASQKWTVFAFDRTDLSAKTGDAANITADLYGDGASNAVDDTNPTEKAHGYYEFDITQAESNYDHISIDPVSATGDIQVIGVPGALWTMPPSFNTFVLGDAAGVAAGLHSTTDGKVDAIQTDIGDFSGRTNDQSLLDVLGVPDVANKDLYTLLVTDRLDDAAKGLEALRVLLAAIPTTAMRGTDNAATETKQDIIDAIVDDLKAALILVDTTIGSNNRSTTSCELTAGSDNNDEYIGMKVILDSDAGDGEYVSRTITDYVGASKTVTWTPAISEDAEDGGQIYIVPGDTLINVSANTLLSRLTAARAGYLDELAAANIPADIDTLLARLTAARAGYLDELSAANLPADIDTLLARLTAARAGYLDELAAANIPADIDTLLTRITAAVALASVCTEARLAELGSTNLPADIDAILADTVLMDKWIKNKMVFSGNDLILYDDDESTPLLTWTLSEGTLGVSGPYDRAEAT